MSRHRAGGRFLGGAGALLLPVAVLLVSADPAFAHSPVMGIGGIPGGILHALLIPEHGMSLLALGLVLGKQDSTPRRAGLLVFAVTLVGGLAATAFVNEPLSADVLMAVTGVLGLLIALDWAPPALAGILAAAAGACFALDSRPDVTTDDEAILMLVGSGIGAVAALGIVAEVSFLLRGGAQVMVARVLGSWITAIAILVVALRIVTQMATG